MVRLLADRATPATPKQRAILRAGRALFLRHGIRKVRVEEVCADAQVSKRTFYKYFRDKDALAIAVLGELFAASSTQLEAVLGLDCALEDKVRRIMAVKSELASQTSATFYREALDGSTEPGRYALRKQQQWDQRVRHFYLDAQANGQIREDVDIDVLMALLVRSRELVKDPHLERLVPDLARLTNTVMTLFFYGIVPRESANRKQARLPPERKKQ
jgi:AcrR family transcriptional regulator